ncbi:MAG: S-methyl-5-thioribose-1-phosphate isomerase [Phycisphaerales bacterium]|nr:S-methyl-5-thioribose-1-phosphate isomerase [Phycisphaerales bacterium]
MHTSDAHPTLASPGLHPAGLPETLAWVGGSEGHLRLLDQTRLPSEVVFLECKTAEDVWNAIRVLSVRGAPAIGVAAAFGLVLGLRPNREQPRAAFLAHLDTVSAYLRGCRPTAVNLAWALGEMRLHAFATPGNGAALWLSLWQFAQHLAAQDAATCRRIGEFGAPLIPDGGGVLTHCNAGALATVAYGTALAALYVAHEQGKRFRVYADETRPLLQGARLTAFELAAAGLDVTVLCDHAAASLMQSGQVQAVIVGADRIAANGDVANKIGTYTVALAAQRHGIPFYVAAPRSTFDLSLATGAGIPIEQRAAEEVTHFAGLSTAPAGVGVYNPAFDVTPAELITALVTERGLIQPPAADVIRTLLGP